MDKSSKLKSTEEERIEYTYFKDKDAPRALLFYLILIAIIYAPVFFTGKTLLPGNYTPHGVMDSWPYDYDGRNAMHNLSIDLATPSYYEFPINKLVGDEFKSGRMPLWNPYQAAGTPLAAQYSTRAFFPYQILENISPVWMWDFFLLGRLLIAGIFTFLFLRLISLSFPSAFLGGALYMFSGTFVWFINLEQLVNIAMVAPALLLAMEMLAKRARARDVVVSAAVFALVLLGGQPETALYVLFLGAAYYIFTLIVYAGSPGFLSVFKYFRNIIVAFVIGFLLAAPVIFPFVELWGTSHNIHPAGGDMGVVDTNPTQRAVSLFTPTFYERPLNPAISHHPFGEVKDRYGKVNYSKILPNNGEWDYLGGYSGVVMILITLAGLICVLTRKTGGARGQLLFFFIFGAGVLLKSFGYRPFLWLGHLPFFDLVWSQRWAGPVWTLSLSISAAMGIEVLKEYDTLKEVVVTKTDRFLRIVAF
ncbi:MAG: hypothetical protein V3T30_05760, partial [Thermodesulfobacteriota bacterium]